MTSHPVSVKGNVAVKQHQKPKTAQPSEKFVRNPLFGVAVTSPAAQFRPH